MTNGISHNASPPDDDEPDVARSVRSLLKPRRPDDAEPPAPDLLQGVQRRIRQRSGGKFYGDGWSTSAARASTYIITSVLMLFILAIIYFAMVPGGLMKAP